MKAAEDEILAPDPVDRGKLKITRHGAEETAANELQCARETTNRGQKLEEKSNFENWRWNDDDGKPKTNSLPESHTNNERRRNPRGSTADPSEATMENSEATRDEQDEQGQAPDENSTNGSRETSNENRNEASEGETGNNSGNTNDGTADDDPNDENQTINNNGGNNSNDSTDDGTFGCELKLPRPNNTERIIPNGHDNETRLFRRTGKARWDDNWNSRNKSGLKSV